MKKIATFVLMLCLTLSRVLCYASGVAGTENETGKDGIPIELIVRFCITFGQCYLSDQILDENKLYSYRTSFNSDRRQ
jgi:hypothetical protein